MEVFDVVNLDVEEAIEYLNVLDMVEAHQVHDDGGNLAEKRVEVSNKLWIDRQQKESMLKHKSRYRWIRERICKY